MAQSEKGKRTRGTVKDTRAPKAKAPVRVAAARGDADVIEYSKPVARSMSGAKYGRTGREAAADVEGAKGQPLPGLSLPAAGAVAFALESGAVEEEPTLDAWFAIHGTDATRSALRDPARQAELIQELVVGVDDRTPIDDTESYPYSCICSLVITAANGKRFIGTGWLVGPRTVITAGHCVYMHNQGGWAEQIEVFPGRNGGHKPFRSTAKDLQSVEGWVQRERPEHDYGAIILADPLGDEVGFFGYATRGDAELQNMTINIVGYPGDKDPGTMWGHARRLKRVEQQTVVYDIDTFGGQSGAGLIQWDGGEEFYVVGIHNYGDLSGNSATRITQEVYDNIKKWKSAT